LPAGLPDRLRAKITHLVKPAEALLMVEKSGFGSARLFCAKAEERGN
jgi:hypothetical protein